MKSFFTKRRITGAIFAVFSSLYLFYTMQIPDSSVQNDPGPRLFPYVVGGIMLVCSLILLLYTPKSEPVDVPFFNATERSRFLGLYGLIVLYVVSMDVIGYTLPTFIALSLMCWMFSRSKTKKTPVWGCLLYGAVCTVVIWVAFQNALHILLPRGRVPELNFLTYIL